MTPVFHEDALQIRSGVSSPPSGRRERFSPSRPAAAARAVFWLDGDGGVSRWTQEAAALFGFPSGEALQKHFRDLFAPPDRDERRPELALGCAREDGWWEDVGWRLRRDGQPFWALCEVTHLRAPDGVGIGYQVSVRDLTALAGSTPESLMHPSAPRLLAVGRVAAAVAHDLSNILAALRGFAAALERHLPPGGASSEAWQGLVHTCDRGTAVVRRLLDLGRPQPEPDGEPTADLPSLIRGMEPLLRQVLPSRILLVTMLDERLPEVCGRAADLELILLNLVVNARDAIDGEGTIAIEARRATPDGDGSDGDVLLAVRDSGAGMAPAVQERAFEPFFTTKGGGGTGLGLALVRDAALACGGSIQVDSRRGRGTRVGVRLRAAGERAAGRRQKAFAVLDRRGCGLALLCAESSTVQGIVASLLRRRGLNVVQAYTPDRVRALLRDHAADIDLAVVAAPVRGLEAVDLFGAPAIETGRPPAVFLAGNGGAEILPGPVSPGDRILAGPLDPERLLDEVTGLLSEAGKIEPARAG